MSDKLIVYNNNNNNILHKITSFFTAFHTGTHISFILTKHYPLFKNNKYLYGLLYSTDILTHLGLYNITHDNLYLYTFYWHIIKVLDSLLNKDINNLRKSKLNNMEVLIYLSGLLGLKNSLYYKVLGFYMFVMARSFDLCW